MPTKSTGKRKQPNSKKVKGAKAKSSRPGKAAPKRRASSTRTGNTLPKRTPRTKLEPKPRPRQTVTADKFGEPQTKQYGEPFGVTNAPRLDEVAIDISQDMQDQTTVAPRKNVDPHAKTTGTL